MAYLSTVRPFDAAGLRAAMSGTDVVLVEPYLAGTSTSEIADALHDRPHRVLSLGIRNPELRRYGSSAQHRAAHGLDAVGIRTALDRLHPADRHSDTNDIHPRASRPNEHRDVPEPVPETAASDNTMF